jgi:hypothetical protein
MELLKKINTRRVLFVLCIVGAGVVTTKGVQLYAGLKHLAATTAAVSASAHTITGTTVLVVDVIGETAKVVPPKTATTADNAASSTTAATEPSTSTSLNNTSAPITATSTARPPFSAPTTTANPNRVFLEKYIKAVNIRRAETATAKKTVTTTLGSFNCPAALRWILEGRLPFTDIYPGEEAKKLFGQGVVEEQGAAAKLRPAITLSAGETQTASGNTASLSGETNPAPKIGKLGKVINDFPTGDGLRADVAALTSDGYAVIGFGSITVTTGEVSITANYSPAGKLMKETISFDFTIRMENVSIGTSKIKKIATLSWGEAPGRREIVIEYK